MSFIRDGLALAGVALALFGLAQWSLPASYVAGGLLLVAGSIGWSFVRGNQ